MKYNVVIHYEGAWNFEIEAENEDRAKQIAEDSFADLSAKDLINNLADSFVCDCWEVESMNRVDNIAKFAQKRDEDKTAKEMAVIRQIEELKEKIITFKTRIEELLKVGNACLEYNIPLEGKDWKSHEGYDTNQFITNGWSHLLGFVNKYDQDTRKRLPFTTLGIAGGGSCWYNLETDGVTVDVSGKDTLHVLKRFVDEFDEFETEFYKYVDKVTK